MHGEQLERDEAVHVGLGADRRRERGRRHRARRDLRGRLLLGSDVQDERGRAVVPRGVADAGQRQQLPVAAGDRRRRVHEELDGVDAPHPLRLR